MDHATAAEEKQKLLLALPQQQHEHHKIRLQRVGNKILPLDARLRNSMTRRSGQCRPRTASPRSGPAPIPPLATLRCTARRSGGCPSLSLTSSSGELPLRSHTRTGGKRRRRDASLGEAPWGRRRKAVPCALLLLAPPVSSSIYRETGMGRALTCSLQSRSPNGRSPPTPLTVGIFLFRQSVQTSPTRLAPAVKCVTPQATSDPDTVRVASFRVATRSESAPNR